MDNAGELIVVLENEMAKEPETTWDCIWDERMAGMEMFFGVPDDTVGDPAHPHPFGKEITCTFLISLDDNIFSR
jgi:hypothetical protein